MSSPTSPSHFDSVDPKSVSILGDLGISEQLARVALQVRLVSEGVGSRSARVELELTILSPSAALWLYSNQKGTLNLLRI